MALFNKQLPLKILFVASEAAPFAKVGGLGEVMWSLPKALRDLGHDARVMIPRYATIDTDKFKLQLEIDHIRPTSGDRDPYGLLVSNVLRYRDESGQTIAYFLENQEYYEKRANVYGYADDTVRWVLLAKSVLEFIRQSTWRPDIVVAADWQTGFIPNLLRTEYKDDTILSRVTVVFSIHNLLFQGMFNQRFVSEMDFDGGQQAIPDFFDPAILKLSGMRRGIMYADTITTVSPTYAKEILLPEFGETLNKLLDERKGRLFGILNGIDVSVFDPATDDTISTKYTVKDLDQRASNKLALQKRFGLIEDATKFVIGSVGRLDNQKGHDIIIQIADALMNNLDFQFVVLGDGQGEYRLFYQELQQRFPGRVGGHFAFDNQLPRVIFSGADAVLVPSRFEPCGLVQMEAMRYGCIPIVRRVGGLADSVKDYQPGSGMGTGFVFEKYDAYSLLIAIVRALDAFGYKKEWEKLMQRCMREDFSWRKSAQEYLDVFQVAQKLHEMG